MRVKKDINLMRVARSRNNVNEKKTKNQTKKLPPKSSTSSSSSSNPVASPPATSNTTTSQTAASGDCATSQQNQTSDNNTGTNAAAAEAPIESTVKMKKDSKECQAAVTMPSSSLSPKKLANSKSKSNASTNKSNNSGKTTNDQKWKKKGGKNRINSSCVENSQSGGGGGECDAGEINTEEKDERKEEANIDVENNKKNQSVTSAIGASNSSPPVTSVPGSSSSNSNISISNKNHKESQQTSGSNGDKKSITSTKKQTNKVCKELRNLGVNSLIKKDIDDKICRDVVDVKTSICEMVKTKSRINVQSTYNRKSSASEEPKDVDKSKKCTKTKSETPKTKKFVKKNKKVTQVEQEASLEDIPVTKPAEETTGDHKEEENLESNVEKIEEPDEKAAKPPEEKIEVESKYKKKKKKEKEIIQREPEREKSDEDDENEREEENELDKSIQESTKMCIQKLDELLESTTNEPAEVAEIEAPPPVVVEKLEDLEKLKQIEEIIIKNEQDSKVERIFPLSESTIEQTDELEKTIVTVEKEKKKPEANIQKRKYVKKAFLAKKKKEPAQPAPAPILVVPPPKETPEIKDIYDFNESGNNSDSMDLSNIATKSSSSTSNQPPIYKRKLNSISKSSSFDNKSINNLQLTTPELSNESNKSTVVSSSVKNEIDNGKEKVKSDEEIQEKEKIVKNISESDNNNSDESDEETLKSKINKSLKLAKAGQKKQPVKPPKPKKLTKENVKKIENLTKKKSKYVKTSSSDCSDGIGDESDASSTLSLRRAKEQLKSAPTAKARKMKLYGFWSGPKRHRMASLNALAKVQCLYENESRSAQELGFVRPTPAFIPPNKTLKPPTPNTPSVQSDDEDYKKEDEKPEKKPPKPKKTKATPIVKEDKKSNEEESNAEADEDDPEDDAESIIITNRILRTGPGLRGAGNLWEVGSMSSISDVDAVYDSDKSYKGEVRQKKKKKKPATTKGEKKVKIPPKPKEKPKNPPPKKKVAVKKPKPIKINIEDDDDDNDEKSDDDSRSSLNLATNKRKRRESDTKPNEFKDLILHKRMASLNASAILTATYEVERQLDKLENAADKNIILSDDDSINEIIIPASPKKLKEVKSENEDEDNKEQVRPVSTSVVILQDTDVTITGVYVNSSLGSNQEAYCKMQYRVQSSVTEERVLRPTGDPPKSYTPLSALSNMRPPGAQQAAQQESCTPNSAPSSRCESPPRHQPYHPSAHPSIGSHPSMSAFCTPTQLQHHDTGGYYQPAGPLITSHLLPSQQSSGKGLSSPLENDNLNLQQPPQSTSAAESSDSDVLITGGDLTPRPQTFRYGPQAPGPYSRPIHQMHCPPYPPSYYSPYSQHPQDMCYSPPYQPYYPTKVYPAAGPYRRYIPGTYYQVPPNELYEPPPSNPPPPSGSQIVPAGPSGPQHMEHYPGPPYYGYSPGAAQCYTRGLQPYIETPYPSNCPCPMQSCPKNVHTGPLIGSNTSKGPVIGHLGSNNNNNNGNNSVTNSTIEATLATCKTEDHSPVIVKPETTFPSLFHDNSTNNDRKDLFEKVASAPLPHYVNNKVMEPEISISPARGSTGLPVAPPTQITTAAQPVEQNIVRKARIGKNMVRERQHTHMMAFHTQQNHDHQISSIICSGNTNMNTNNNCNNNKHTNINNINKSNEHTISHPIKQEAADIIKIEHVKEEKDEVILIIDKPDEIDEKPNVVNLIDDQSDMDKDEMAAQTDTVVAPKRRRLLMGGGGGGGTKTNHTFSIKKTSFKGYKNLIKRTEHKSYLSTSPNSYPTKLDRTSYNNSKMMQRFNVKSGKIGKHRMLMKVRKVVMIPNKKSKIISANNNNNSSSKNTSNHNNNNKISSNNNKTNSPSSNIINNNQNQNNKLTTKETNNEPLQKILENASGSESIAARGYYSESEIIQSKKLKSKKSSESRSKSESSRNKTIVGDNTMNIDSIETTLPCNEAHAHNIDDDDDDDNDKNTTTETVTGINNNNNNSDNNNLISQTILNDDNDVDEGDEENDDDDDDEAPLKKPKSKKQKQGKKCKKIKSNKKKCKQKILCNENVENNNNNNNINNNLIDACDKTNNKVATTATTTATKRNRSRTRKFSNKKRHRVKQVEQVEEVLVPRRTNSIPKWSNGWSWEGESFQGKIFLNSDDAPVLRTCYHAMRHSEGDIIRPRDCVLLRAGGKRFELPYVAKVAYLWENPEDGEMMMSLLWYYRPEHTEQGRQPIDSLDEVFASRHKDHNSVACIEDKCYVLTFSEYCRYRRELKGFQEGIEEIPSIVPPLYRKNNRQVPPNTSPELVMFCRRVYEFRLKRLMKTPN